MAQPPVFADTVLPGAPAEPIPVAVIGSPTEAEIESVRTYVTFFRNARTSFPDLVPRASLETWETYLLQLDIQRNVTPALALVLAPLSTRIDELNTKVTKAIVNQTNNARLSLNVQNNLQPNKPLVMLVGPQNTEIAANLVVANLASLNSLPTHIIDQILLFYAIPQPIYAEGGPPLLQLKRNRLHAFLLDGTI